MDGYALELDVTCVAPYTTNRRLNHTPDGNPVMAARLAEQRKYVSYHHMDRTHRDFKPLAFDVFGGTGPVAEQFISDLASRAVHRKHGLRDGDRFDVLYSALISQWKARLSSVIQREVANCIIEGANKARFSFSRAIDALLDSVNSYDPLSAPVV